MSRSLPFLTFVAVFLVSCQKNNFMTINQLRFSADTIYFDTVFASAGSVTKQLRVKNIGNSPIKIDEAYLAGGTGSQFKINIDGEPVSLKRDISVAAGDSFYVFIEVSVDPSSSNSPVSISDSILFVSGQYTEKVLLQAWGQDINLISNSILDDQRWSGQKPYLIYGTVFVDTLRTLVIDSGTRIYFHRNSELRVAGTLLAKGTLNHPILFAGDRLEKMYEDIPGQWLGIRFLNPSSGNRIEHMVIRGSVNGVTLGELSNQFNQPDLYLYDTYIMHSTISCLSAVHGSVIAANCVFTHSGKYCISTISGGSYRFVHCSVFNLWEYGIRLTPSVNISEKSGSKGFSSGPADIEMDNSVIYGDLPSELNLVPAGSLYSGTFIFDHCLIRLDTAFSFFWNRKAFPGSMINTDPRFIAIFNYDFRPDTLSPLVGAGNPVFAVDYPLDIRGFIRTGIPNPDIGAYERVPGEQKK
ncbi:MAG TPA: hypothetical protein VMT63_05875 [Bacteroidales bacterium]|nr:hypothetical protein [Bacteroidales bacterium]